MSDRDWFIGLTLDEKKAFLQKIWDEFLETSGATQLPETKTGFLVLPDDCEQGYIDEAAKSLFHKARYTERQARQERIERFLDWSERMELKADIDDDTAFFVVAFKMEYARRNPNEKLSHEEANILIDMLVSIAEQYQCAKVVEIAQRIAKDYDKDGIPRPLALRTFDPKQYKAKRGRPKGFAKHEQYLDFARRIYAQRRQEGCFPARQWNVEELPFRLSDEIEQQIASDAGITNHFERLAEVLKIPLSARAISQFYLGDNARNISSLRRIIIIEEMAAYCFEYWFGPNKST